MPILELVPKLKHEEDAFWTGTVVVEKVNDVESVSHMLASFRIPMIFHHQTLDRMAEKGCSPFEQFL